MSNASNLSTLANVLDDGSDGQFLKSTGSGGVAFDTVAAGAVVYATADLLPLSGFAAGDMAYVTATNRFYINNGSGWYSISLVNTNPNITSVADAGSNTTPFTLATDQTATVVTVTAADPEDVPLTYGYSVTSGSLNGSTVAQGTGSNTNVFTVTPHASQDATFTLTFTASDGINQATSANAFSLSFVTTVTDSKYTTLLATAISTGVGYNFSSFGYDSVTQSTGRSGNNEAIRFNNNGTKMYIVSDGGPDGVYQYSLSTAYDITSASYDNVSFSVTQDSSPRDLHFNANGTKMFILGTSNRAIYQYTLNPAYDLSTASYDNVSLSVAYATSILHFHFNGDGTKIYVGSSANPATIYERTLAGAYNISSETSSSTFMYNESDLPSGYTEAYAHAGIFNNDGTKMYLLIGRMPDGSRAVIEYNLSTAYSLSTISRTAIHALNSSNAGNDPRGFTFNGDGTKLLILDETNPIYRMNTTGAFNITDSSSSPHSIQINGDTFPGTFSPYRSGGYSMNFGSGASLKFAEASTSNFNMGTNAFTIEMWIRPATTSSGSKRFFHNRISGMANGRGHIFQNGSNLYATYRGDNGTDYELTASSVLTAETWTHVCFLRDTSDNTLKLYYDGNLGQSVSVPSTVGIYNSTSNTNVGLADFGDIANLRVVNGTAITPSSSSILEKPTNVTNTVLLMIGGNFVDYSGNAPQINNYYGPPEIKAYGPLDYVEYSATDHGGSIFVDNLSSSSDDVSLTLGSAIGTGDFSISGWFYPPEVHTSGNKRIWTLGGNNNANGLSLLFNTSGQIRLDFPSNGTSFGGSGSSIAGRWTHFCIRRVSGTATLHLDGVQKWTASNSINLSATNLVVGRDTSGLYGGTGYISDFKISTSSLEGTTVPSSPTSSTGALVHVKGTDASIIDKSQSLNLKLVGDTIGSTTTKFTGAKSMYFDGTGDGIIIPHSDNFNLNGCDWTIEYWFNLPNPNAIRNWTFIQKGDNTTVRPYTTTFRIDNSNGVEPRLFVSPNNSSQTGISNNAWQTFNAWHHVAFVRVNSTGVITRYINGTTNGTVTSDLATNTENLEIGTVTSASDEEGYIQDLRISKGKAHYTANFTPPTAPLEG